MKNPPAIDGWDANAEPPTLLAVDVELGGFHKNRNPILGMWEFASC